MKFVIATTCVNYTDMLSITYSFNKHQNINNYYDYYIITSTSDANTIQFCKENELKCFITDSFFIRKSCFNKGAALNHFITDYYQKYKDESFWFLQLDADIILDNILDNFITGIRENKLHNYCTNMNAEDKNYNSYLYSCSRKISDTTEKFLNNDYFQERSVDFIGYFQLFHISKLKDDLNINLPIFFQNSNASKYDVIFRDKYWPRRQDRKILNGSLKHIGPICTNWKGRVSELWEYAFDDINSNYFN